MEQCEESREFESLLNQTLYETSKLMYGKEDKPNANQPQTQRVNAKVAATAKERGGSRREREVAKERLKEG